MKLLLFIITLIITNAFTQEIIDLDILDPKARFEQIRKERLQRIRRELVSANSDIYSKKKLLGTDLDLVSKLKLEAEIENLQKNYEDKKLLFIETATNVNLKIAKTISNKQPLSEDIKQIFDPLIHGVKLITLKPRQIQGLKDKITTVEIRLKHAIDAQKRMDLFSKENKAKNLNRTITKSKRYIKESLDRLKIELEDAQFKLIKLESSDESIVKTFSSVVFEFIKTKGKNLFLAILIFIVILWFIGLGQNRFIQGILLITNRKQNPGVHWVVRPIKVLYSVLGFIAALFFAILTLYVFNDWVMITFIMLLVFAIIWGSKEYFLQYFEQIKMVLNFGSVRENERMIYQGIAWRVKNIGYYARLVNPALSGGSIRINTKELLNSYSRPAGENEPWFPTKTNDWIDLSDGTYGKVTLQSQENVAIKLIGSETKFIPTQEFLKLNPVNLSNGFSVEYTFGLDYAIQKEFLDTIIPKFKDGLKDRLYKSFESVVDKFNELIIEFSSANSSSLDIRFFLKCDGSLASRRGEIRRKSMGFFVEVCNENELIIPFNQLQVHMSKE